MSAGAPAAGDAGSAGRRSRPLVRVGQVLRIPEQHYCYGRGTLILRVTAVDPRPHPALEWLRVQGIEIRWDGADGDHRDVLVRVAALRTPGSSAVCDGRSSTGAVGA